MKDLGGNHLGQHYSKLNREGDAKYREEINNRQKEKKEHSKDKKRGMSLRMKHGLIHGEIK